IRRYLGYIFSSLLEDVTSNVGGTGRKPVYKHRSRASAGSGSTASPCRDRVLHVAAFGHTLLEIVPLSLSRRSPAARWLRGVGLDRQRTTRLRELCADRGCPVGRRCRRRFSQQSGSGKRHREERSESSDDRVHGGPVRSYSVRQWE